MKVIYKVFLLSEGDTKYIGITGLDMAQRVTVMMSSARKAGSPVNMSPIAPWMIGMYARGVKPQVTLFYEGPDKAEAKRIYSEKYDSMESELINTRKGAGRLK